MTQNITRLPADTNTNNLQSNKFTFIIPDFPIASYLCQSVAIPGVSTTAVPIENPFSTTFRHGDKIVYDPLSITFQVDEDMKNWEEIYNWMKNVTYPHNHSEYIAAKKKGIYKDCTLTINTNSNIPNIRFRFYACQFISLGSVNMTSTDDANQVPVADLTIQFDTFSIERIS